MSAASGTQLPQPPDRADAIGALYRPAFIALAVVAVPVVGGAAAWSGLGGVYGAVAGLGLVAIMFGGSVAVLRVGTRRLSDPRQVLMLAGAGFCVRLLCYALVLILLSMIPGLDRIAVAAGVFAGVVVTLGAEMRAVANTPRLLWLDPADTRADGR